MASPQLSEALEFMRRNAVPVNATVPERRVILEARARALPPMAGVHVELVKDKHVRGEWVSVEGGGADLVMLHIHGGGYVAGSAEGARDLTARLCRAGRLRALSIDYRLAPESPFPAGLEDCVQAYRWLLAQDFDARSIVVVGASSGEGWLRPCCFRFATPGCSFRVAAYASAHSSI